jgi:hypothetical protein
MSPTEIRLLPEYKWRMAALAVIAMTVLYYMLGYLPVVVWIAAIVLVISLVVSMVQRQTTDPCIVLTDDGVFDRRLKVGVIRWSDIRRISCHSLQSAQYISLDVRDPAKYEARRPAWLRLLSQVQRVHGMSSIAISTNGLDVDRDTLVSMLHQGCENASHRKPEPA